MKLLFINKIIQLESYMDRLCVYWYLSCLIFTEKLVIPFITV
jgi:hypothetical protein